MKKRYVMLLGLMSIHAHAVEMVHDSINNATLAQMVTVEANTATNTFKASLESIKQTLTQNDIFLTSKEIWTTARETQEITQEAYDAVVGLYYTPQEMFEQANREYGRMQSNPPRYVDGIFAKYGNEPTPEQLGVNPESCDSEGESCFSDELVRNEIQSKYQAGNGMLRDTARVREREKLTLDLMTKSSKSLLEVYDGEASVFAEMLRIQEKQREAKDPKEQMGVLMAYAALQTKIQIEQYKLSLRTSLAYGGMNYEGEVNLFTEEQVKASETAAPTDYSPAFQSSDKQKFWSH
ncbi:hypothetical protein [Vibrio sp. 10N.261.46.A3]|uniref:hypothetical protein n=1 Tax=Vibrio sp. 10N.261.46.A3 TaxID=3229658 RepID=UPI00354E9E11